MKVGRPADVKDSEWIAELLRHGLLRASFIPDRGQRPSPTSTASRASAGAAPRPSSPRSVFQGDASRPGGIPGNAWWSGPVWVSHYTEGERAARWRQRAT